MERPVVLSIAGLDPSSGAGVTADVKTIAAHHCYGATCITLLTIQSTQGITGMEAVKPAVVADTLSCLAMDLEFAAVKIGALGTAEVTCVVEKFLKEHTIRNVVLDPVLISSTGACLLEANGLALLLERLLPLADVITPNVEEAIALTSGIMQSDDRRVLAKQLGLRARNVVITGGNRKPPTDFLLTEDGTEVEYPGRFIKSSSTHGTGCAFSTSLACWLALGHALPDAVGRAKEYVAKGLAQAYPVGKGIGPLNHFPEDRAAEYDRD